MTPKEFKRLVARDSYCLHCGEEEAIAPNHRANRGMGGKNARAERPSNLVVICSWLNGQIESSAFFRDLALEHGWKIESWQDPATVPVFDACRGEWYLLNDDYGRKVVEQEKE